MNTLFKKNWLRMAGMLAALATSTASHADKIYFVHNDHLGTPQVMTDENKNVVWEVDRDPWGNITNVLVNNLPNNVSLPGQYDDAETSYSDNWHRTYDKKLGQYLQFDPIGLVGGINAYGYAYQNPVMWTDFSGLYPGQLFDSLGEAYADAASYISSLAGQQGWKYEYSATFYDDGKECPKYTYYFTSQYLEDKVTLGMPPNGRPPLGFMHNHPSGNPNLSGEDQLVADSQSRKHKSSIPITTITRGGASKTYHGSRGSPGGGQTTDGY